MNTLKTMALSTAAIIALSTNAMAMDTANFTSHHLVDEKPYENYVETLSSERKLEIREFLDYETREPCQFYQPLPDGFVKQGCDIVRIEPKKVILQSPAPRVYEPAPIVTTPQQVLQNYQINFPFDSSRIEPEAIGTLNTLAREIKTYNPSDVTVQGYTDTSGPSDYNIRLSERRAMAVSNALTERGVSNRILDAEAFGETNLAVPTDDGVKLRENRRVVIEFLK